MCRVSAAEPRDEGVDDGAGQFEPDNKAAERLQQVIGLRVMVWERKVNRQPVYRPSLAG